MNKIIEVDILSEDDIYERYNAKKISHSLINYILESVSSLEKKELDKIVINNHTDTKIKDLVEEGLKEEYLKSCKKHHFLNNMQMIYLLIGIIAISISLLMDYEVLEEIILIGGWVFVWEAIELEITSDLAEMRRRKNLEKILSSKIEEKMIK